MARSTYYVDPTINTDTGAGTLGDPWGAASGSKIARAISLITRNTTDGDEILVLATGTDTLAGALSPSGYTVAAPLVIRGVQSDGSDAVYETGVGIPTLDLNSGAYSVVTDTSEVVHYRHLDITNGTGSQLVVLAAGGTITECYLSDSSTIGVSLSINSKVLKCSISNCGDSATYSNVNRTVVSGCYIRSRTTDSNGAMTAGIDYGSSGTAATCHSNIVSVDGATIAIRSAASGLNAYNNSILSSAGTGTGITSPTASSEARIHDNLIDGFSGAGGVGIAYGANTSPSSLLGNNALYQCATPSSGSPTLAAIRLDDITLTETPFSKLASDTFSNRLNYYAPRNTGGIQTGAFL